MVEPQLTSILSPKQLRFIDDARAKSEVFEPLMVPKWFDAVQAVVVAE